MTKPSFDFSDGALSSEERFVHLLALSRGVFEAMGAVGKRLGAYNDLLQEEVEDRPAAMNYLQMGRLTLDKSRQWVEGLSRVAVLDSAFENIDLRPLLEGAVVRCNKILAPSHTLELSMDEDETVIRGGLFQLQNLFVKTMQTFVRRCAGSEGRVSVVVREHELDARDLSILKSGCKPGSYVLISLIPGEGELELAGHMGFWDAFLEADDTRVEDDLILLQAYGTVLLHDGDMFFKKVPPEGVGLTLALPVEGKRKDMQAMSNLSDRSLYGSETILLVDDEDMIWDVIIDMLQELGYAVILAENGLDAVEIYRENPGMIDLVMLDMIMPKLDGHQTFHKLKEIDPEARILLSSGYVSQDEVQDVLDAGAVGFLQKPYRMVDLARRIRAILDRARK